MFGCIWIHLHVSQCKPCKCMYLYADTWAMMVMLPLGITGSRQEAKRLAEEVNQLHLNTTGPRLVENLWRFLAFFDAFWRFLALFGAFWRFLALLFIFDWFLGTSGLYWTLHKYPEDPAMLQDYFVEASLCVITPCGLRTLFAGAQLGMASKPHTRPSNEKSGDSHPQLD